MEINGVPLRAYCKGREHEECSGYYAEIRQSSFDEWVQEATLLHVAALGCAGMAYRSGHALLKLVESAPTAELSKAMYDIAVVLMGNSSTAMRAAGCDIDDGSGHVDFDKALQIAERL